MNCDCISDLKKKMVEHYREKLGVPVDVECQNTVFILVENRIETRLTTSFKLTAQSKGFVKGKVIPVTGNYCPICGKAVVNTPAEPATEAA